jgi:hypothetical protein
MILDSDIQAVLDEAKRHEVKKSRAISQSEYRDDIRKWIYEGYGSDQIVRMLKEKGQSIAKLTIDRYREDPIIYESIKVEHKEIRNQELLARKREENKSKGMAYCETLIDESNKLLQKLKDEGYDSLTEGDLKILQLGLQASKTLPILRKDEPEIFDTEDAAALGEEDAEFVKQIGDAIAKRSTDGTKKPNAKS